MDPALQHVAGDYGDMFVRRFAAHGPAVQVERFDVVGGQPPPPVGAHDALVVTGSRHSVTDDLPWIAQLEDTVRAADVAGQPVVGICFGHQVIAQALGGRVDRATAGWGVGVHTATVLSPQPWMQPSTTRFSLLMSHQDQVVELPPGATVVATSDHAPVAAFTVRSMLGLQGHPEFVVDYLDALLATRVERIGAEVVDRARASLATPTDHETVTRWLVAFAAAHTAGRRD